MIDAAVVSAPGTDLLRLLAVPVFAWAAVRDVRTRRVPNRTWVPLAALGVATLAWDGWAALTAGGFRWQLFALQVGISLLVVIPLAYVFWRIGGFGGADAKALMVLALVFPTYPTFETAAWLPELVPGVLPAVRTTVGVFSLTILTDAVLLGLAFPVAYVLVNALGGNVGPVMVLGRPIRVEAIPETHGRLLETPDGFTRRGLDLDALRMYLRWRGTTLAAVREHPARLRDPASLPEQPNAPTDGAVADGGQPPDERLAANADAGPDGDRVAAPGERPDDPWGAKAFVAAVGEPYGADAETLREGLEVLASEDVVWVSPGLPFMVPLFLGLVIALAVGDLLFWAMTAAGIVP